MMYFSILRRQVILFCFSILFCLNISAQKEANIWYFGQNAGLDFNSGTPVALTDGSLNTHEGCASIADSTGALLFYTDGTTVWNKNHQVMTNGTGLLGHPNSTQSSIIVPKPGSFTNYYVFTVDAINNQLRNGLNYSEVDVGLSGGLGAINSNKNIQLVTPVCEKLTAVKHSNNRDIWVIVHLWNSDAFYAYLVTSGGVTPTPIVSHTGITYTGGSMGEYIGYMKASPNGKYIALAIQLDFAPSVYLFNFNNTSGAINNSLSLGSAYNGFGGYGLEFSPNSKLLYAAESVNGVANIFQYNLEASNIPQSQTSVAIVPYDFNFNLVGALQLATDHKIYVVKHRNPTLGVINNPNVIGSGCNFNANSVPLNGKISLLGLPSFVQSFFVEANFTYLQNCFRDSTRFTSLTFAYDSLSWDFGDIASGNYNTSALLDPVHLYTDTGNYTVRLIAYNHGISDTVIETIHIDGVYPVNLGSDTELCNGKNLTLSAFQSTATYVWQNNSTNDLITITQSGQYWVTATKNGCSSSDTINVTFQDAINDTINDSICLGEFYTLPSGMQVSQEGIYIDTLTSIYGCDSIVTIQLKISEEPQIQLATEFVLCQGSTLILDPIITNSTQFYWQDSSTALTYHVTQEGTYFLIATNFCGETEHVITVTTEDCSCELYVPTVFSPNNDGINDIIAPLGNCGYKDLQFKIYNRWGELIFETNDIQTGWKGIYKNAEQPSDDYVWILEYSDLKNNNYSLKGIFTLLR